MKTNSGILDVCILLLVNLMEGEGQQYFNPMEVEEKQNLNPVNLDSSHQNMEKQSSWRHY